jgi:hypothetical protein
VSVAQEVEQGGALVRQEVTDLGKQMHRGVRHQPMLESMRRLRPESKVPWRRPLEESELSRTRLSVVIASSLDGYIATRDGSLAWLEEAARCDEAYGYGYGYGYGYESFLDSVDALAMGRALWFRLRKKDIDMTTPPADARSEASGRA